MAGYISCTCRKIGGDKKDRKTGKMTRSNSPAADLSAVAHHNDRSFVNPEIQTINPEMTKRNTGRIEGGGDKTINQVWEEKSAGLYIKPGSARAVEANVNISHEFFHGKTREETDALFRDCLDFLAGKYGKDNIMQWNVHYDETTPHMHVLFVPVIERDGERLYRSSFFLGGPKGTRDLQTEIAEKVGKKWGLERGVEGSKARHTNQVEWARELKKKDRVLSEKETELDRREKTVKKRETDVAAAENSLKARKKEWNDEKNKIIGEFNGKDREFVDGLPKPRLFQSCGEYARDVRLFYRSKLLPGLEVKSDYERKIRESEEKYRTALSYKENELKNTREALNKYSAATPGQLRELAEEREAEEIARKQGRTRGIRR